MDNNEFAEEWKNIIIENDISNYEISNSGIVRNKTNGHIKKPTLNNGYYRVNLWKNNKDFKFYVHRLLGFAFIPNPENKPNIDHINNITTDNRLENLRWCNQSENGMNEKISKNNTSGFKGISWDKSKNKWDVSIMINYKKTHLGRFASIEDAVNARRIASTKLFGEFQNACEKDILI